MGIYFNFGTKLSWNEGIDTNITVEWVLFDRIFDFLGGYLAVTVRYLVATAGYCWLMVVTARYRSLLLVPNFSMNAFKCELSV